jgi:anti-sigma factor RsiW
MEGTLPAPDRARFDLHLEECPGCVNYVSQMQQVVATLGSLPADEIEPEALDELLVAFRDWKRTG